MGRSDTKPRGRGRLAGWAERTGAWLSEEALTWLLIILILDIFVLPVLGPSVNGVVLNLVFTVLLFTGLATVASRGVAFVVVGILALWAGIMKWIADVPGMPGSPAGAAAAAIVVFGIFTLLLLLRTLSPGPITRHRIEGAIATYLLIAVVFAFTFELLVLMQPDGGALRFNEGISDARIMRQAVSYFSMVTLTTVGYGDVTPVSPLARQLAMFEGVIGQLYPAIIIGWMVGSMKRRGD